MTAIVRERTAVPIESIGPALADLWEEFVDTEQETPLGRILTINLIGVVHKSDEQRVLEARSRLLTRHPCRAFLVLLDESCGEITSKVAAETRVLSSCRQMVLEQVTLRSNPRDLHKLPGLIRPLLVNDIPVHQFWGMELPEAISDLELFGKLAEQTTVDSSLFANPPGDLKRLRQATGGLHLVDLTWFRLRPWRRGLAEAFEQFAWTPEVPTTASIRHASEPGAQAASHLLAHWLEDRLGAQTEISSTTEPDAGLEPLVVEVRHGAVHVSVTRRQAEPRLVVAVTLEDRCLLPFEVVASRSRPGDLLAAAVDVH